MVPRYIIIGTVHVNILYILSVVSYIRIAVRTGQLQTNALERLVVRVYPYILYILYSLYTYTYV